MKPPFDISMPNHLGTDLSTLFEIRRVQRIGREKKLEHGVATGTSPSSNDISRHKPMAAMTVPTSERKQ